MKEPVVDILTPHEMTMHFFLLPVVVARRCPLACKNADFDRLLITVPEKRELMFFFAIKNQYLQKSLLHSFLCENFPQQYCVV